MFFLFCFYFVGFYLNPFRSSARLHRNGKIACSLACDLRRISLLFCFPPSLPPPPMSQVNGDIPPKVKNDAHAVILDFIRSRPPLRRVCAFCSLPCSCPSPFAWLVNDCAWLFLLLSFSSCMPLSALSVAPVTDRVWMFFLLVCLFVCLF